MFLEVEVLRQRGSTEQRSQQMHRLLKLLDRKVVVHPLPIVLIRTSIE
jgi:hypothetical protein